MILQDSDPISVDSNHLRLSQWRPFHNNVVCHTGWRDAVPVPCFHSFLTSVTCLSACFGWSSGAPQRCDLFWLLRFSACWILLLLRAVAGCDPVQPWLFVLTIVMGGTCVRTLFVLGLSHHREKLPVGENYVATFLCSSTVAAGYLIQCTVLVSLSLYCFWTSGLASLLCLVPVNIVGTPSVVIFLFLITLKQLERLLVELHLLCLGSTFDGTKREPR